ncbi:multidrug effflux MFS transporter [Parvularcula maris]|uniref:Bcr/CflA family efflux transporter n=1 Tax=Parvularcula maris TaxID=2965077 RepID=A0A9X2L8H7_9PROT|nr:multidrug effflux MFS transporter [Parvularcula maris]MCQ8185048.1 multidrug effflux MFS transporter [Parvularcula maris]
MARDATNRADLRPAGIRRAEFIALVASLMALNALAIDVVLPAYPEIASAFSLDSDADAGQVLVTYILGFGLGQLLFGPITDRFGRRGPLMAGVAIYIAAALLSPLMPSFALLLGLRFLQGIGAAATRVIAVAIVRDTMKGRAMASLMSLVMMVFMVVPILAPMAGEGILRLTSWQGIFYAMAVLCAVVAVWFSLRLPETLPAERRRPLTMRSTIEAVRLIARTRVALFYGLATGFIYSALFAFLTLAQPLFVGVYGYEDSFTFAFAGVAALMGATSLANSRLVTRLGARRLSHTALTGFLLVASALGILSLGGNPPFWVFFGAVCLVMPLFGLIGANMNAIAMEPVGEVAGSASAILGFLQSVLAGLLGAGVAALFGGEVWVFAAGLAAASLLSLLTVGLAERGRLFRAPASAA